MRTMAIVFTVGLAVVAFGGCSSSSSGGGSGGAAGAPDFDAIEKTLTTPTGTLQAGKEGDVAASYSTQYAASQNNPLGGSSSSSTGYYGHVTIETVHALTNTWCPGIDNGGSGSCSCPGGGSVTYDIPSGGVKGLKLTKGSGGPLDITVGITGSKCVDENNQTIDGKIFFKAKSTKADNSDLRLIESLHFSVSGGSKSGQYDVDFLLDLSTDPQRIVFAVDVPDGKVLVSGSYSPSTKSGEIDITDKNGTTKCTVTNGAGSCSDPLGKVRDVKL